ncbi:hypothetical protein [Streptomyces goshikiensis]|uniref:hypothetical protein n=1 Tax=Streptomyces goshikiensis TaxID=1942 RepID=UPI0036CBFAA2
MNSTVHVERPVFRPHDARGGTSRSKTESPPGPRSREGRGAVRPATLGHRTRTTDLMRAVPAAHNREHGSAAAHRTGPARPASVDVLPVVEHVHHLQQTYELASVSLIAAAAGLPGARLLTLMAQYASGQEQTVDRDTVREVLAVAELPPPAFPRLPQVTDIGLLRRLQGLCAQGWTLESVAEAAGTRTEPLEDLLATGVGSTTARGAVLIAWKRLSHLPGPSEETANLARQEKWVVPLAWDEETIDDLRARPCGQRSVSGRSSRWSPALLRTELEFLRSIGLSHSESLQRLGLGTGRAHTILSTG